MAIISRDAAISRRRAEKDAVLAAGAQVFAITETTAGIGQALTSVLEKASH